MAPDDMAHPGSPSALPSLETLTTDTEAFNAFVYYDLEEAVAEWHKRQNDEKLDAYLKKLLPDGPPDPMRHGLSAILFRHVATPNFEAQRFATLAAAMPELHPMILEYTKDSFTNRNGWKFSVAKLCFHKGINKLNEGIIQYQTIIDINAANFKPIYSLETLWGENFVDFHHHWFDTYVPEMKGEYADISPWIKAIGPTAKDYYKAFLALFLKNGIQFEYFLLHGEEEPFTKEIILPSLLELQQETGYKPLIVRLQPRESEGSSYWLSYPLLHKEHLDKTVKATDTE